MSGDDEPETDSGHRHGLNELIAERRAKAQRLKESDPEAFPYSYPTTEPIATILAAYEHLSAGEETEDAHRVAGRIAARRGSGKAAFLDLVDRTGKIQLHARIDVLGKEPFARLSTLDLGDLIGVDGAVLRSRRGELSLRVDRFQILAKALRPPPDKHHGLSDVETRYRRRELDLIASEDARKLFIDRARIISAIRAYLDGAGFRRGRDAGPAAAVRRRAGAAVHDAPQRTRPRPVLADRHRAVPQAPARRAAWRRSTSSARTSATRASRPSTIPSSRSSSGTRPTPITTTRRRSSKGSSAPRRRRPATLASWTSRRRPGGA